MLSASLPFLVGWLFSGNAHATTITSHSCTVQADNSMRFDCTVDLSGSDTVRIGFRPQLGGAWNWSDWRTGDPVDFTLYNFYAELDYEYKVEVAGGPVSARTNLTGGPDLPPLLDELKLDVVNTANSASEYVLFDTFDCQNGLQYIVAVSRYGWIAWYQELETATGITGATTTGWSYTSDHTIFAIIDRSWLYEWAFDGSEVMTPVDLSAECSQAAGDYGPCPHHDAFRSDDNGKTYVVTGTMDLSVLPTSTADFNTAPCNGLDGFVDDGFRVYDSTFSPYTDHSLMNDMGFDPTTDGGPNPVCPSSSGYWDALGFDTTYDVIDWTHANSISAVQVGSVERVNLSLRHWDEVVRYDPVSQVVDWTLNGTDSAYSDFTIVNDAGVSGDTDFGGQHHVTEDNGLFLMFDNRDHVTTAKESRAIQLDLDTTTWYATILRSWEMREISTWAALDCSSALGSAVIVPGTLGQNVLTDCGPRTVIQEIDEYDGLRTRDPTLSISLDRSSAGGWDYCDTSADPASPSRWYRAWPLVHLGEF